MTKIAAQRRIGGRKSWSRCWSFFVADERASASGWKGWGEEVVIVNLAVFSCIDSGELQSNVIHDSKFRSPRLIVEERSFIRIAVKRRIIEGKTRLLAENSL